MSMKRDTTCTKHAATSCEPFIFQFSLSIIAITTAPTVIIFLPCALNEVFKKGQLWAIGYVNVNYCKGTTDLRIQMDIIIIFIYKTRQ